MGHRLGTGAPKDINNTLMLSLKKINKCRPGLIKFYDFRGNKEIKEIVSYISKWHYRW